VSFQVDLEVLRLDMQDWLTRKFGDGKTVELRLSEKGTLNREQSAVQRGESKAGGLESVEAEPGEDA
jgi:hypothetical protein